MGWARLDDGFHDPTCVYRLFTEDDELLYVGIAMEPFARLDQHYASKDWWGLVSYVVIEWFATRIDAADEEIWAIRNEFPRFNIQGLGGPRSKRPTPERPTSSDKAERYDWRGDR